VETNSQLISKYLKRLYQRGLTTCFSGNISLRELDSYFISQAGIDKSQIEKKNVAQMSYSDDILNGVEPSSEYQIHRLIYQSRSEINAIIHAHPPFSTAFALSNQKLDSRISSEMYKNLGIIAYADYAKPGSLELARIVCQCAAESNTILMMNHGVIVLSENIHQAYYMIELLEQLTEMTYIIKSIGQQQPLSEKHLRELAL